ncbi:MAG: lipopolysaccharide heptosyltransferase II [Planctomycetes bacterium]|nr:lipopolysaccharide heptosyltransferase II [Planctomycetota bacterium]
MLRDWLDCRNVVVRAPNALGDIIMATGAFARLAAHFGKDRLSLICSPAAASLLGGNTWFKEVIAYDRGGAHKGISGGRRFIKQLRERKFDLAVIFPNSFSSAWQMMRAGVRKRLGYFKEGRGLLLGAGRKRDEDADGHFVPKYTGQYFMDLLDVIGLPPGSLSPQLPVSDEERGNAAAFLADNKLEGGPLVIIAPGAAFGPSKLWPAERFAEVARALREGGARVMLSYAPGEEDTVARVQTGLKSPLVTSRGLNLGVLKALVARASLVISNDTGPRHLAVALGRPVLCLMGPNDPRYSELAGAAHDHVIVEKVDCSPYAQPCQLKQCPIDHRCMKGISVERVLKEAKKTVAAPSVAQHE